MKTMQLLLLYNYYFFLLYLQYIEYNMDLNQVQLFTVIDRTDMMEKLEKTTRVMNYTERVNLNSNTNNPHQRYSQLDISSYLGCFGKENSQPSQLLEPSINYTPRKNDTTTLLDSIMP